MSPLAPPKDPRLTAGIAMLRRTGVKSVQVRYHDDEEPLVWLAVAEYVIREEESGQVGLYYEAAAALDAVRAVMRLCEQVIDGGECKHCGRPTGLEADSIETMPMNRAVCWYQYDPEMETFRRGCE